MKKFYKNFNQSFFFLNSLTLKHSFYSGLKEADDINLYLQPLKVTLEEVEQADYQQVCQKRRYNVLRVTMFLDAGSLQATISLLKDILTFSQIEMACPLLL